MKCANEKDGKLEFSQNKNLKAKDYKKVIAYLFYPTPLFRIIGDFQSIE